jgi:hypothetical protein
LSGNQFLAITNQKGGVLFTCTVSITTGAGRASNTPMTVSSITPNTGNYIVDVNGKVSTALNA